MLREILGRCGHPKIEEAQHRVVVAARQLRRGMTIATLPRLEQLGVGTRRGIHARASLRQFVQGVYFRTQMSQLVAGDAM